MREEDLSAEQPQAEEEARLPPAHAQSRGASGAEAPPHQGPSPALGLIWRVRDRASFRALATGRRRRRGPLTVTTAVGATMDPPRVAFSIGRHVGNAVARNRVRRQLRAVVRSEHELLHPGRIYLISAAPRATTSTYGDLRDTLRAILIDLDADGTP